MKTIKTCPFCGASAVIESMDFGDCREAKSYRIGCTGTMNHTLDWWDDTEDEAITTWNQRPTL